MRVQKFIDLLATVCAHGDHNFIFFESKIDSCVSVRSAQYSGQIYTIANHILILGCW